MTSRRRKIVKEIARFQRLSSVSVAESVFHDADRSPRGVFCPTRQAVESRIAREAVRDACQQAGRIDAVVVREGDDVSSNVLESDVSRARQAGRLGAQVEHVQAAGREYGIEPRVVVLIDHDHPQRPVLLRLQRIEQASELLDSTNRRDDQVERR